MHVASLYGAVRIDARAGARIRLLNTSSAAPVNGDSDCAAPR